MSKDYEKGDVHYDDVVHDSDITGDKSVAADDVRRHAALTEEELVVEKKLRRKMDMIIMPMVVTVRYWSAEGLRFLRPRTPGLRPPHIVYDIR